MTEDRISELRALCAKYEQKKTACEAAGLKAKAADIAADGVGRLALEALPELLDALESELAISQQLAEFLYDDAKVCTNEFAWLNFDIPCKGELGLSSCDKCWRDAAEKAIAIEQERKKYASQS